MDFGLKPCATTTLQDDSLMLDRLSSLPNELLIRILSLLPTKDAVATCSLSSTIKRAFPWITTLDLSDSPVSNCLQHPYAIHRFPSFVSFVETVLRAHQSRYLTSFRLHLGKDYATTYLGRTKHKVFGCEKDCFPDLNTKPWISFAITRIGLKQLDLRIHVREPGQLPPAIFLCETLEVLKLDVNLGLDQVCTMPSFRLPNLKLLHLYATLINEDGLLPRLVSSCPILEDLKVVANWNHVNYTRISSSSLRRLHLEIYKLVDEFSNTDFVLINTPNLEYLGYYDNLPKRLSITNMSRLVEAEIAFATVTLGQVEDLQVLLSLIKALDNVHHLSLHGIWAQVCLNF
ncbi:F-box/LRR-repeat protein At4g14103-like [Chenopodium quinoa]|uniref:F-box/LRR-repeat protein At4g14103-like n=1 Tax=Chenopodium quinoa TaxID=63459 RepID=UPI000B776B21|nr:F-box/LRR-repeat protein At4g14103-like [Chenopodium quinoa]